MGIRGFGIFVQFNGLLVRRATPLIKGSRLGRDPVLQVQTDSGPTLVFAELLTWIIMKDLFPQPQLTFETGAMSPVKPLERSRAIAYSQINFVLRSNWLLKSLRWHEPAFDCNARLQSWVSPGKESAHVTVTVSPVISLLDHFYWILDVM